jgi:integrase/recombinase XerD
MNTKTQFKEFLLCKNYCNSTIESYCSCLNKLIDKYGHELHRVSEKELTSYLSTLSISLIKQNIGMMRILYRDIIGQKAKSIKFKYPRREKRLPQPIDKTHLLSNIYLIENLKHKAIMSIAYSVGLRVSEVINLKISDIDSKRMMIRIEQAKGKKDAYLPLTEMVLLLLREYYLSYKPKEYLFNGQNSLRYSSTSCNKIIKKYIGNQYHFHQLRHSTATHLHESGVSLLDIQNLLRHESSKSTEIYAKVSNKHLKTLPLPI